MDAQTGPPEQGRWIESRVSGPNTCWPSPSRGNRCSPSPSWVRFEPSKSRREGGPSGKERFGPSIQEGDTPMICVRSRGCRRAIICLGLCCAILGSANTARGDVISVTNLVTEDQAVNYAQITDPFLKNVWGISHSTGSQFCISDNAT